MPIKIHVIIIFRNLYLYKFLSFKKNVWGVTITMDFVTHLPRTSWKHDAVWVIVDQLTKSAHFLVVRITFTLEEFCKLYIREIV